MLSKSLFSNRSYRGLSVIKHLNGPRSNIGKQFQNEGMITMIHTMNKSLSYRSYSSATPSSSSSSSSNNISNIDQKITAMNSNIDLNSPYNGEIPILNSHMLSSQNSSVATTTTTGSNEVKLSELGAAQAEAITQDPSMLEITGLPTFIEVLLHHLHSATGWSWMVIVPAFTLLIRSALLPFAVKQRINVTRLMEIKPQLDKFKEKSQENRATGASNYDNSVAITKLLKDKKCHPALSYILPLANLPFFISAIIAMREMAATFPSMKTAGMLWFTDLSAMDPYFILPIISSASYLLVNELTLGNAPNLFLKAISWVARIMALLIIPFSYTIPSIVYFYWIPSSIFTLAQIYAFKSPRISKLLGMPVFNNNQPIIPVGDTPNKKKFTPPPTDPKKKINRI
ncbi:putative oxidase assembly protein [Heterostelium album PN500]|uniref:Putative oxidase assembly protein n=1 Tax=Heterostelium pallidum (strain ATCC 26659 / Pp 5 / PN500) TaxID=670386 RepID=D3BSQ2_HETP5|nr:putative oxidase assembly protein [Heterostelium album PN500]EFA75517.1 putative oxidase assembly protein [Heterostelium album PN500]|eukprot:XP_020427651.1 putative oxidase assembly protein [Heterostelium album PN500]